MSIRDRSGSVNSNDKLVAFLYMLLRDEVTPGRLEEILREMPLVESEFSNGWLANYAKDIAMRLK
jgi:hypothetical protein